MPCRLFASGFRPAFLAAGFAALLLVPAWIGVLVFGAPLGSSWPPTLWHAHEMLFGFIGAAIAGFLLTAVPSWTGRRGFAGPPLVILLALWLGAREGVYFTRDQGKSWLWIHRLPFRDVDDLSYDPSLKAILVSSRSSDQIFAIDPKTMTWKWWQTGYHIALIRAAGDRLVAATLNDGVLVQPHPAVMEDARSATPPAKH